MIFGTSYNPTKADFLTIEVSNHLKGLLSNSLNNHWFPSTVCSAADRVKDLSVLTDLFSLSYLIKASYLTDSALGLCSYPKFAGRQLTWNHPSHSSVLWPAALLNFYEGTATERERRGEKRAEGEGRQV